MINIPDQQYMIDHYGKEAQMCLAMEECAELIQAINKLKRGKENALSGMTEEIADVLIMIEQLEVMFQIPHSAIQRFVDCKHERQMKRIKEELEARERDCDYDVSSNKDELNDSKWIPCSERLPKEGQYVLASINKEYAIHDIIILQYTDLPFWHQGIVEAWQPLPEPYKESEEE